MKIRKIMAASLAATMTLTSLTACGDKADFFQMLSNISAIESGYETFNMKLACDDADYVSLTVASTILKDDAVSLEVSGTIDIPADEEAGTAAIHVAVSNPIRIVAIGDSAYIEIAPLCDFLLAVANAADSEGAAGTLTPIIDSVKSSISAKYIKIDAEGVDSVSGMIGMGSTEEGEAETTVTTADVTSKAYTFINNLVDLFEKHFKDVTPSLVSAENGKYTFKVTKENFTAFSEALINFIKTDFVTVLDSLATADLPVDIDTEEIEYYKTEEGINELVTSIQELSTNVDTKMSEFETSCYIADNKTKDSQFKDSYSMGGVFTVAMTDEEFANFDGEFQKISFTFDGTISEYTVDGANTVKTTLTDAVSSSATIEEVMNSVYSAMGMGTIDMSGIDTTVAVGE